MHVGESEHLKLALVCRQCRTKRCGSGSTTTTVKISDFHPTMRTTSRCLRRTRCSFRGSCRGRRRWRSRTLRRPLTRYVSRLPGLYVNEPYHQQHHFHFSSRFRDEPGLASSLAHSDYRFLLARNSLTYLLTPRLFLPVFSRREPWAKWHRFLTGPSYHPACGTDWACSWHINGLMLLQYGDCTVTVDG